MNFPRKTRKSQGWREETLRCSIGARGVAEIRWDERVHRTVEKWDEEWSRTIAGIRIFVDWIEQFLWRRSTVSWDSTDHHLAEKERWRLQWAEARPISAYFSPVTKTFQEAPCPPGFHMCWHGKLKFSIPCPNKISSNRSSFSCETR